jgi:hypothetical protein
MRVNFTTQETMEILARKLNLETFHTMQDWEIMVADPDKIQYFLDAMLLLDSDKEKICLSEIILASFDHWLEENNDQKEIMIMWSKILRSIEDILIRFIDITEYWVDLDLPVSKFLESIVH